VLTIYKFLAKAKYLWHAKNRHGVHSPFVYAFNELVLNKATSPQNSIIRFHPSLPINQKQLQLLSALSNHYAASVFEQKDGVLINCFENAQQQHRILLVNGTEPLNFAIENKDILLILNIHNSKNEFSFWQQAVKQEGVKYAIDLFEAGLIFYNNDFLSAQYFVLKF
jgi:hypothetical protein